MPRGLGGAPWAGGCRRRGVRADVESHRTPQTPASDSPVGTRSPPEMLAWLSGCRSGWGRSLGAPAPPTVRGGERGLQGETGQQRRARPGEDRCI